MQLFYSEYIQEFHILLVGDEARHCRKVLRKKQGEQIFVFDGKGILYTALINSFEKEDTVVLDIIEKKQQPTPATSLHLAVSILKNQDRFEWMVEKATEMGVSVITPLVCERTEKAGIQTERLRRIAIAAAKQSLNFFLPEIHPKIDLDSFLCSLKDSSYKILLPICTGERTDIRSALVAGKNTAIIIGPEGDFTEKELKTALANGAIPVTLGERRYRSETAALQALFHFNSINNFL